MAMHVRERLLELSGLETSINKLQTTKGGDEVGQKMCTLGEVGDRE